MAKSLRSQRVRKMKAIRRKVYYKAKEMERLKTMVANTKKRELEKMAKVVTAETLRGNVESQEAVVEGPSVTTQEAVVKDNVVTNTDVDAKKMKYNKHSLKDENGQYPIWLHPRKIRKIESRTFKQQRMKSRWDAKKRMKKSGSSFNRR